MKGRYFLILLLLCITACTQKKKPPPLSPTATNQEAFTRVYEYGIWGKDENGMGWSGDGSCLANALPYMEYLQAFLNEHQVTSVVDLGCGDWQFSQHMNWSGIAYLGIDVVPFIIERNNQLYGKENLSFVCKDVTLDKSLPEADLLICKDVLQHLKLKDIYTLLAQFSNFKYCLITNDRVNDTAIRDMNGEVKKAGDCRSLDLTLPPFNLECEKVFSYTVPTGKVESLKEVILITRK